MPNPALTPSILQTLLAGLSRTIARGAADDPAAGETAAALLAAFQPGTPIQAMLAAQAVALHHAAMDCFGRAMETGPEDHTTATRLHRNAASLTRAFTATLHTLHRCQVAAAQAAETEQQDLLQREEAAPPGMEPAPEPSSPQPDGWEDPLQRENDAGVTAPPVALAQARAQGSPPDVGVAALGPRFREDDSGSRPSNGLAQNPSQPELLTGQAEPADEQLPHRRWEDLTEAEQFALLYPERVAAGATCHEDAHLWLTKPGTPAPTRPAR